MIFSEKTSKGEYAALFSSSDDLSIGSANCETVTRLQRPLRRSPCFLLTIVGVLLTLVAAFFSTAVLLRPQGSNTPGAQSFACSNPALRREWRSFSEQEKYEYIAAVQCLRSKPSRLGLEQTLYDDFPWTHSRIGNYSHGAAAFLAWHRYLIHIYETALKQECGYRGFLAYWDWTLDWEDIRKAPIWSPTDGFGGDGDERKGNDIVSGHCVADGPFSGLILPFLDLISRPHCLSRGFQSGEPLKQLSHEYHPSTIQRLLLNDNYEEFNLGLEHGAHVAIPRSVRGDFALLTAPNDPVFILHHTQLDRLWWRWQQLHPNNAEDYLGKASHNGEALASLDDLLPVGKLATAIPVSEIIDTRGGFLCYTY